ncbi:glutamate ABC transporter substrate-binding protein [Amycolatopsis albispora]|uniref:Glutamate-binding protein n=1 Tax=Amycolatopsis albispora TaxID=1804986 RepID=A0A344L7H3_9PSEU|nr:glutamate ABC transporter substrate-binding protein [Amycolatopsis albispora]AXB43997.1 glutamate-binding protein [Amycolatopsis albispora]
MRLSRVLRTSAVVAVAGLTLAACGGGGESGSKNLVARAKEDKKITIGIKFDQPGLGLQTQAGKPEGFDVDVAKYIAKELGVEESGITWKEAQSAERENLIEKGDVDFIVATYSITDKRKEKVAFAGPYFVAGQGLLVRADNTDITGNTALNGKKLCSVKGSTPAQKIKDEYSKDAQLQEYGKYSDCITALENGSIDAVTTDDVILAGFAAKSPGKFKLVGEPFSKENYGVGLKKDDAESRTAIANAITKMQQDGSWKKSLEANVGPSGYKIPEPSPVTEK